MYILQIKTKILRDKYNIRKARISCKTCLCSANASKSGKEHASHEERRGASWKKVHSESYSVA